MFPVERPGGDIFVPTGNFFSVFSSFFFAFQNMNVIFSPQPPPPKKTKEENKGTRKFAVARLVIILYTRWTGHKLFFRMALVFLVFSGLLKRY